MEDFDATGIGPDEGPPPLLSDPDDWVKGHAPVPAPAAADLDTDNDENLTKVS